MASNPPGRCCTQGVKHEGEPVGTLSEIDGVQHYISKPSNPNGNGLLYLTDVMGPDFLNHKLIADQFAANGYLVVVPDMFDKKPVTVNPPPGFNFMEWKAQHPVEKYYPVIEKVYKAMQSGSYGSVNKIVATGYCWGAKPAIRLLAEGLAAAAVFHPSFVTLDEIKAIKAPLFIGAAETDTIFPEDMRKETEVALKEIKAIYQINLYSGVEHGFAVRGNIGNPVIKWAKEQAFMTAVDFFGEHTGGQKGKL